LVVTFGVFFLLKISKSESFQFFGELVNRVDTIEKVVALTFDDGPTKGKTEEILAILREADISATFYLVGNSISKNADQASLIMNEGHEIGNHSYSHKRLVFKGPGFVSGEIEKTNTAIQSIGYSNRITFRPPYGGKLFVLPYYLNKENILSVTWDVEPDSVLGLDSSPETLTKYALEHTRPGSIILMHVMFDSRQNSMQAIPGIIKGLKSKGYSFVTVSELLRIGDT